MKKISIIIPVYNAQNELRRSIDSVLAQTVKDIEVILVDDGSKDNSLSICQEYAQKDERIVVIHQENEGVSVARNKGIDVARGEYIGFVDSDDWIEPNMYERMLMEADDTGADVVMCDATTVYEDTTTQLDTIAQLPRNTVLQKSDFMPTLLLAMAGSVWRCIYSKYMISDKVQTDCGIRFPLGVKFSEDRIFNLYAFGNANKVCYIKESYYNRFMNKKSAVHRFHNDYFEAYKKAAIEIEKAISTIWENDTELQKAYLSQFISGAEMAICNYYYKTSPLNRTERKARVVLVCDDSQLRRAIEKYGSERKSQWILDRKYYRLILYAKLANWKHGR